MTWERRPPAVYDVHAEPCATSGQDGRWGCRRADQPVGAAVSGTCMRRRRAWKRGSERRGTSGPDRSAHVPESASAAAVGDVLELDPDPVRRIHQNLRRDPLAHPHMSRYSVLPERVHDPVRIEPLHAEADMQPERFGSGPLDKARCWLYPDFPKGINTMYPYIYGVKLSVRPAQVGGIDVNTLLSKLSWLLRIPNVTGSCRSSGARRCVRAPGPAEHRLETIRCGG